MEGTLDWVSIGEDFDRKKEDNASLPGMDGAVLRSRPLESPRQFETGRPAGLMEGMIRLTVVPCQARPQWDVYA